METFAEVIKELGGSAVAARGIGEKAGTVRQWRRRGRIPSEYWARIVEFAVSRGKTTITEAVLAAVSKNAPRSKPNRLSGNEPQQAAA